jgi:hypothetical protein
MGHFTFGMGAHANVPFPQKPNTIWYLNFSDGQTNSQFSSFDVLLFSISFLTVHGKMGDEEEEVGGFCGLEEEEHSVHFVENEKDIPSLKMANFLLR